MMRLLVAIFAVLLGGLLAWGLEADSPRIGQNAPASNSREPVIVELFTSEGCSSCPPADALLAELDRRQPLGSAEVIAIEEHVDYWDQLGWRDPFSSSSWTARQTDYVSVLHNGGPYTPEMVVDGQEGFVGSRGATARQEIEKAATVKKTKVELSEVSRSQKNAVVLKVNVENLSSLTPKDTAEVILAVTESGLYSSVKAGENNGKELHHSPVLRELKVIGAAGKNGQEGFSAQPSVKLESSWKAENLRAIVFVQERKSRRILGAATLRLAPQDLASH